MTVAPLTHEESASVTVGVRLRLEAAIVMIDSMEEHHGYGHAKTERFYANRARKFVEEALQQFPAVTG